MSDPTQYVQFNFPALFSFSTLFNHFNGIRISRRSMLNTDNSTKTTSPYQCFDVIFSSDARVKLCLVFWFPLALTTDVAFPVLIPDGRATPACVDGRGLHPIDVAIYLMSVIGVHANTCSCLTSALLYRVANALDDRDVEAWAGHYSFFLSLPTIKFGIGEWTS